MPASPPTVVLGETVIEMRDTWNVDGRVYCEVRTVSGYVATLMLVDRDDWIVCHFYRLERGRRSTPDG